MRPTRNSAPSQVLVGEGTLLRADALDAALGLPEGGVDLVYLDPPFFTGRTQHAERASFRDSWDDLDAYLAWLSPILEASRRCLAPTGSLYVHLDWHASHYVKVELDRIFGRNCFLNHIVWLYGLGGSSPRYWPRKHDDLLWYGRRPDEHYFEPIKIPASSARMRGQAKKMPDFWNVAALNNMAIERVGYPTQKPEALLDLVVRSSCPPGGLVADFFVGSGTTCVVAAKLGRRYFGSDVSEHALSIAHERLGARSEKTPKRTPRHSRGTARLSAEDET